jgi:hypothetical protein
MIFFCFKYAIVFLQLLGTKRLCCCAFVAFHIVHSSCTSFILQLLDLCY